MSASLYLEDIPAGSVMRSGTITVTAEEIVAFASKYDPQPFHLSDEGAAGTMFGKLAASGWHTAAMTMRLQVESGLPISGGIVGSLCEQLQWKRPVRPGDTLHVESEVLETRRSDSRPGQGWAKIRSTTVNQNGEPVQVLTVNLLVPCRPVA
jgi:acyl dehydratase